MKIGLVTIFNVPNYGAILQAYALSEYLRSLGHEVILFDVDSPKRHPLIYRIKRIFKLKFIDKYQHKYYPKITRYLKEPVDLYMVGSDQVWNPDITSDAYGRYFLSFGLHNNRVSYAASFGNNEWTLTKKTKEIAELLHAVTILRNEFGITGRCVLDPCFLLDWSRFVKSRKELGGQLVSYKLEYDRTYDLKLKELGRKLLCDVVVLRRKYITFLSNCRDLNVHYCSVEKWLLSIASADYVVTDSFHGMVFSILFKKQFVIFPLDPNRLSRIDNLLEKLNLLNRKISSWDEAEKLFKLSLIDYDAVNVIISNMILESKSELRKMLL